MLGSRNLLAVLATVLIGLLGLVIAVELTQVRERTNTLDVNLLVSRLITEGFDYTELSEEDIEAITSCAMETLERWRDYPIQPKTLHPTKLFTFLASILEYGAAQIGS